MTPRAPGITLDAPGCVSRTFRGTHTALRRCFPAHAAHAPAV
ncbi:hypothetical protein [Streptomyces sp. NPDC048196]